MQQAISQLLHVPSRIIPFMKEIIFTIGKKYEDATGPVKVASISVFCTFMLLLWFVVLITSGI